MGRRIRSGIAGIHGGEGKSRRERNEGGGKERERKRKGKWEGKGGKRKKKKFRGRGIQVLGLKPEFIILFDFSKKFHFTTKISIFN